MDSDSESEHPPILEPKKEKTRRPPNSAFRQQRLKAFQPILTPRTVLPLFFGVMALFALFGGLLIHASNEVQEILLDYTWCGVNAPIDSFADMPKYEYHFKNQKTLDIGTPQWRRTYNGDMCTIQFDVPATMKAPVYLFYRLTNFYQNHRRYVLSYNEDQIEGKPKSKDDLQSKDDCKPLVYDKKTGKPYYPCGLIANSMFNDTFGNLTGLNGADTYNMTNKGISWSSDRHRFKKTQYNYSEVVPPPNWAKQFPYGYSADAPIPDVSTWEEFQNWMRTAGLPTFAKLAKRNDSHNLDTGKYSINVGLNFNTTIYKGKKFVLLSTRTVIGGRNDFLGIAYCVVAGISGVLGVAFLIQHIVKPRRLGDHSYLSWNQEGTE